MAAAHRYRIGVDIGGTFTDVVVLRSDGALEIRKVLSTPDDYSRGIAGCLAELLAEMGVAPAAIDSIAHATTVANNAILEHKGARTGLVTTRGFRDVLEMRRLRIPVLYDLRYEKPAPLVPRALRFEVGERVGPRGEVWEPLDDDDVERVARALEAAGVEAVAVSLMHAYANPSHERRIAQRLQAVLGDRSFVTCSTDILPEIREYERTSTAVVNAYVGPLVQRYLASLTRRLAEVGLGCPIQVMVSSGGVMALETASTKPAYLVESGPAAGAIACARVSRAADLANTISFDMGGTTAKAAMVENGQAVKTTEYEVASGINLSSRLVKGGGYPIRLPFVDVSEIGAGGGSIIALDDRGVITVGPESAGSDPGPVCYARGGKAPTLTDALVAIGFINPHSLVGGTFPIDAEMARAVLRQRIAAPLGKALEDAAYGVLTLACATMTRAVKAVSTYRGRDPRDFSLVAFGGNGAVVAAQIAAELQMTHILVPPAPGVFSALGLLLSDAEQELTRTLMRTATELAPEALEQAYAELEHDARAGMQAEGYPEACIVLSRFADLRYAGQAYELTVPVIDGRPDPEQLVAEFGREHERTYGHRSESDPVDLINIRVIARVAAVNGSGPRLAAPPRRAGEGQYRAVFFGPDGWRDTPVLARADLGAGRAGPVVVEEYDATCVVPPGWLAGLDPAGNVRLTRELLS
jgi:N-methylhydantoinase A